VTVAIPEGGVPALPGTLTRTSYEPPADQSFEAWEQVGGTLFAMARSMQWWLGDWIRHGEERWGERYSQALELTGLEYGTLRDIAWTCSRVLPPVRSETLPFWHHKEVAALNVADQDELLAAAETQNWTQSELRAAARERRTDLPPPKPKERWVDCPHCGGRFDLSSTTRQEGETR